MQTTDIVIAGAVRTAVGAFNGGFANIPAHELGAAAVREAIVRAKVEPGEVDEVILGQILSAGEGQNQARQASIGAGLPKRVHQPGGLTSFAVPGSEASPSECSRSSPATPGSSSPAGRN